jgi:hypothetical protein
MHTQDFLALKPPLKGKPFALRPCNPSEHAKRGPRSLPRVGHACYIPEGGKASHPLGIPIDSAKDKPQPHLPIKA